MVNKFNQLAEEAAVYHSRLKKSVSDESDTVARRLAALERIAK